MHAPLVAITQPFLPRDPGFVVLAAITLLLGIAFWRSARNLQGHAQAGAQVVVSALLPGLGEPTAVPLGAASTRAGSGRGRLRVGELTRSGAPGPARAWRRASRTDRAAGPTD